MSYIDEAEVFRVLIPKDHYTTSELAKAFSVTPVTIQYHAKKYGVGKLMRRSAGGRGYYVFTPEDVIAIASRMMPRKTSPVRHF